MRHYYVWVYRWMVESKQILTYRNQHEARCTTAPLIYCVLCEIFTNRTHTHFWGLIVVTRELILAPNEDAVQHVRIMMMMMTLFKFSSLHLLVLHTYTMFVMSLSKLSLECQWWYNCSCCSCWCAILVYLVVHTYVCRCICMCVCSRISPKS